MRWVVALVVVALVLLGLASSAAAATAAAAHNGSSRRGRGGRSRRSIADADFAATACTPVPADYDPQAVQDRFLAWLTSDQVGATVTGLTIRAATSTAPRGCVAARDLAHDEVLLSLPRHALWRYSTLAQLTYGPPAEVWRRCGSKMRADHTRMAVWLLAERDGLESGPLPPDLVARRRSTAAAGAPANGTTSRYESYWAPYIDLLRGLTFDSQPGVGFGTTRADLRWLRGSHAGALVRAVARVVRREYRMLARCAPEYFQPVDADADADADAAATAVAVAADTTNRAQSAAPPHDRTAAGAVVPAKPWTRADFLWAFFTYRSRNFRLSIGTQPPSSEPSSSDREGHTPNTNAEAHAAAPDDATEETTADANNSSGSSSGEDDSGLVALADLLNHGSTPNTAWGFDDATQAFQLKVIPWEGIAAGTELTDTYGAHGNAHLLQHYGFVLDDDPQHAVWNTARLTLTLSERDDPLYHLKKRALYNDTASGDASAARTYLVTASLVSVNGMYALAYARYIAARDADFASPRLQRESQFHFSVRVPVPHDDPSARVLLERDEPLLPPLGLACERRAWALLDTAARESLEAFETPTVEADDVLLSSDSLTPNQRTSVVVRRAEKRVLWFFRRAAQDMTRALDLAAAAPGRGGSGGGGGGWLAFRYAVRPQLLNGTSPHLRDDFTGELDEGDAWDRNGYRVYLQVVVADLLFAEYGRVQAAHEAFRSRWQCAVPVRGDGAFPRPWETQTRF